MQICLKVKSHSPVRCSDGTETAQLQAESWDAAQKFSVLVIPLVHNHRNTLKNMEFNTCDFLGLQFF